MSKTPNDEYPMTLEEFHDIYSKVPRLTVEVILKSDKGVLLSLRAIEPSKGMWHIPGGTVLFGEKLTEAVERVAKRELNVTVTDTELLGYIEYPDHYKKGLDWPIGIAFMVDYEGDIKPNEEASKLDWFKELPDNLHPDQGQFITQKILNQ